MTSWMADVGKISKLRRSLRQAASEHRADGRTSCLADAPSLIFKAASRQELHSLWSRPALGTRVGALVASGTSLVTPGGIASSTTLTQPTKSLGASTRYQLASSTPSESDNSSSLDLAQDSAPSRRR